MLISQKLLKPGFLYLVKNQNKEDDKMLFTPEYGPCSISEFRQAVIRSMKFIVGHELLNQASGVREQLSIIFGNEYQKDRIIPENKKQKYFNMWKQFAKLPYPEMFIENSTGGVLVQELRDIIVCTYVQNDGKIDVFKSGINVNTLGEMEYPFLIINRKLFTVLQEHDKKSSEINCGEMTDSVKVTGITILNALTYINTKNVSIETYKPSRNETKQKIPNVFLEKYAYHVVDIFHKTKKYVSLKEIEAFSELKMNKNIRAHMVRGHFKEKNSKLFWWNPFLRCKKNEELGFVDKDYNVN